MLLGLELRKGVAASKRCDDVSVAESSEDNAKVFRAGGISYLEIPATNPGRDAAFYEAVFGWDLGKEPGVSTFKDASGHVIGHFVKDLEVARDSGVRPYVFVEAVIESLEKVRAQGGEVVKEPYPEGDLTIATFRDPAGNLIGLWQLT